MNQFVRMMQPIHNTVHIQRVFVIVTIFIKLSFSSIKIFYWSRVEIVLLQTRRKINVDKTRRLLNVQCTFNLRLNLSQGVVQITICGDLNTNLTNKSM